LPTNVLAAFRDVALSHPEPPGHHATTNQPKSSHSDLDFFFPSSEFRSFGLRGFGGTLLSIALSNRSHASGSVSISSDFGFLGVLAMPKILSSLTDDHHKILPELTEPEIYAIGYVAANWAVSEHLIYFISTELADMAQIPLPQDVSATAFKKRIRAFRALVRATLVDGESKNKLLKLANRLSGAARSRNRINHGLWDWEPDKPEQLISSSHHPHFKFEEPFDMNKLMKLGDRIAEINFDLYFPGGMDQAYEQMAEERSQHRAIASREFLLSMMGKYPVNPHLPPTTLQADPKSPDQKTKRPSASSRKADD
jgi:hypothetical protein